MEILCSLKSHYDKNKLNRILSNIFLVCMLSIYLLSPILAISGFDKLSGKLFDFIFKTLGLDISSIIFLKETLLNLKKEGKTILITSHNTKFCEDLADNIYLIFNKNIKRLDYINGCSLEQLFITEIGG